MIVSMTGFGDAVAEKGGTHYAVEIRSLNNRYFKPVIKLPDTISGLEPELEMLLREQLGSGSVTYILKMRSQVISTSLAEIQKRAPFVIDEYHKKLTQRVNNLVNKAELQVNATDLYKEIAVFAERADISEEIQRLTSHLEAFESACRTGEHPGRKLDFITQEMLREANTIASKANDAQIARHIVEIKGAIDRLKEQVQNVE